jgi:hypothetical protein
VCVVFGSRNPFKICGDVIRFDAILVVYVSLIFWVWDERKRNQTVT